MPENVPKPRRGRGRPPGMATDAQKAAMAKGRAKRASEIAARGKGPKATKSRHQMLLDGELEVADLDEQELENFRGRDIDGEFKGRIRPIPAAIRNKIRQRLINKMQAGFEAFLPRAQALLEEIAESSEQDSARVKAIDLLLQRGAGKVPDVVRVGAEDPWDVILNDVLQNDGLASEEYNRLKSGLADLASRGEDPETF